MFWISMGLVAAIIVIDILVRRQHRRVMSGSYDRWRAFKASHPEIEDK